MLKAASKKFLDVRVGQGDLFQLLGRTHTKGLRVLLGDGRVEGKI
jgi:hypothetical protein